ncbi:hypothetical protein [Novosphingobium sp.]|uniref:hypothetical protein n=1 Tax=Novosphingobium sp. TaxID=1874826 RepID=UPI002FE0A0BF
MLIVKVEVWPGGEENEAFEIGRMEIANITASGHVCDYSARITQEEEILLMVPALDKAISVKAHSRRAGPWKLVKRVLDQAFPSS